MSKSTKSRNGEPTDLAQFIETIIRDHRFSDREFDLSAPAGPIYVSIDPVELRQFLSNLYSNAAKFTSPGSSVTTMIGMIDPQTVQIAVGDDSMRATKELDTFLFEISGATGVNEASSSQDLSIVRSIVGWPESSISFDSDEDRGITFYIRLPGRSAF